MLGNTFVQVAINFFGRFNIFPLNPLVRRSLELGRQGRTLVRSPPIGTLFKDGEFSKRGFKEVCVYSKNSS
jgi:hypothetical protein